MPFRDTKLELLRSHVDKLKSTLQLLMQVLTHAYQVASRKLDRAAEERQREEIKKLLDKKDESSRKHEDLLHGDGASKTSTLVDNGELVTDEKRDLDHVMAASAIGSTVTVQSPAECAHRVRDLLETIEPLQQALTSTTPGDDHSSHHQDLVAAYFRTRACLDAVVLGSSKKAADPQMKAASNRLLAESGSSERVQLRPEDDTHKPPAKADSTSHRPAGSMLSFDDQSRYEPSMILEHVARVLERGEKMDSVESSKAFYSILKKQNNSRFKSSWAWSTGMSTDEPSTRGEFATAIPRRPNNIASICIESPQELDSASDESDIEPAAGSAGLRMAEGQYEDDEARGRARAGHFSGYVIRSSSSASQNDNHIVCADAPVDSDRTGAEVDALLKEWTIILD